MHVPSASEPVTSIWPSRPAGSGACGMRVWPAGSRVDSVREDARLFSCEGRMKDVKIYIRSWKRGVADGSGAYSRVKGVPWFWKRRRIDWELVELCVIFRRCRVRFIWISAWLLRRQYSSIRLLWRQQRSGGRGYRISRRTFLLVRPVPDNGRDFCSVNLSWLKLRLFLCWERGVTVIYMFVVA